MTFNRPIERILRTAHHVILMLLFSLLFSPGFAQKAKQKNTINWLTLEQLKDSMAVHPKKIFVDIYSDWCGPCKLMDNRTFPNKWVVKAMNESYYAIKLNGETHDTLEWNGKKYVWKMVRDGKGANALALEIGMEAGTLSYPTIVILDEKYSLIYRYPSYLTATLLEEVLIQYK